MFDEFLRKAADLRSRGERFAFATVVRFDGSASGKPGDKAIIYPDGRIWGWIGGGCTQPAVIKEALKCMEDGEPRFVRISPPPRPKSEPRIVAYTMTCHSGGTLDVYIEPVLPKPQLVIFGRSQVARYLAKLGSAMDFSVTVLAKGANRDDFPSVDMIQGSMELPVDRSMAKAYVVVSTQGDADEEALEAALRTDARYVAFVASRTKAQKVFEYLSAEGITSDQLGRVHSPAGLQIGAVTPEEIALSILAEIVQIRRRKAHAANEPSEVDVEDPVCGMKVNTNRAEHFSKLGSQTFYFCCNGCKQQFDSQPANYSRSA
jgi:xanthine dehydrogenase accessory factor